MQQRRAGVADMVSDVQRWLDDPSSNYGWILTGNEADARTSKRFNSRHNAAAPPSLTIDYTPPVSDCVGDCDNTGEVNVDDVTTGINIVLGFLPVSACPAFAIDGVVNILSLIQGVDNLLTGCPSGAFIDYVLPDGVHQRAGQPEPVGDNHRRVFAAASI